MSVKPLIPNPGDVPMVTPDSETLAAPPDVLQASHPPDNLPGKTPKVRETVTDCNCLNPRHPLYSVPLQTVLPEGWTGNPCEYRFGKFGRIKFQQGQVKAGINGIGVEHLVCLLELKYNEWQRGEHACPENAAILERLQEIKYFQQSRTDRRMNRIEQEDIDGDS